MHVNITAKEFENMIVDTLVREFSTDLKRANYSDIYKAAALNIRKLLRFYSKGKRKRNQTGLLSVHRVLDGSQS